MDTSRVLTGIVESLSTSSNLETVTRLVAEAARKLAGAEGATFVLRDEDQCYYVDENAISPLWKGKRFPLEACVSGWCMNHREVVRIPDIYSDERVPKDAYQPTFVKSLCMIPIRPADPVGAIGVYWSKQYTPADEEVKLLQILANSSATALENLELKRALAQRNVEREDFTRRQSDFEFQLHSLAHDLKNPLATMLGFAELLQMRLKPSEDGKEQRYVSTILQVGDRLHRQIEKILTLYRLSNQTLEKHPFDMAPIAREIIEGLKAQDPKRNVEVFIESSLNVHADPDLIRLALENLLSNSFKYSKKKDTTWIKVAKIREDERETEFVIADQGSGFDPAEASKLFQPLTRLHKNTEFEGTGLGLASVARIINLHGGTVRAEGIPHEGARFYFSLPK